MAWLFLGRSRRILIRLLHLSMIDLSVRRGEMTRRISPMLSAHQEVKRLSWRGKPSRKRRSSESNRRRESGEAGAGPATDNKFGD